jgi:hypothetical protein
VDLVEENFIFEGHQSIVAWGREMFIKPRAHQAKRSRSGAGSTVRYCSYVKPHGGDHSRE